MTIKEQEEVKRIREDYTEKTRGKYEELQSLVASIKRPPQIAAYVVGVAAALLLGFGMCVALGALSLPFAMGVSVGVAGILIAVANVFNTISTNLLLRRRELAMLRSVGMTDGGFRRMLTYECLLYGARALLWGLPAATAVTYWIYRSTGIVYDTAFYVPWGAVAAAVGGVFAVVFASTLYGWRRIRRDNPIEALRREAI